MRLTTVRLLIAAVLSVALLTSCQRDSGEFPSRPINIIVPSAAGGGWDAVGRGIQAVLRDDKLVDVNVNVVNREGGGGAVGLSELLSDGSERPEWLMIGGLAMLGPLAQAQSPLSLADSTPIATLISETQSFVVPANSPYQTINDVIDALRTDMRSVGFGGGAVGNSDHLAAALLVKAAGLPPDEMKYIAYSGGGETVTGLLAGDINVAVAGVSEFEGQLEAGKLRLLAITTDEVLEVAGAKAPTLKEAGYDVDFANWRGIFAGPNLTDEQRSSVDALVTDVQKSAKWRELLEKRGWKDDWRVGDDAKKFVDAEVERIGLLMKELS